MKSGYPTREMSNLIPSACPTRVTFTGVSGGDTHMWDPETIANLQIAARTNNEDAYWQFARHINEQQ